jgi:hypothetical protein
MKTQVRHLKVQYLLGEISKAEYCQGLERLYREIWR